MLYKIVLKVIENNKLTWKYFCSVPVEIYTEFVNTVVLKELDMNVFLSFWAKQDWCVYIKMSTIQDITTLKNTIKLSCQQAYPELYIYQSYDLIPDEDFWIRLWTSSHMKYEIEKRKLQ